MSDLAHRLEDRRLALGLTQKEVGAALGMSQSNYSRLVGGVVAMSSERASSIEDWLRRSPSTNLRQARPDERVRSLARSIERQLREMNRLLSNGGSGGRPPRRAPAPPRD